VRVGISQCLLGAPVRYDGGHRKHAWLAEVLARHVTWVIVCPEVEAGMGTPREPVRLEGPATAPRMIGVDSRRDHTAVMRAFARRRVRELAREELSGYVLKARSPSCGPSGVPRFRGADDANPRPGRGLFAHELMRRFPLLPVTEEAALDLPEARAAFVLRVFAYRAWTGFESRRFSTRRLDGFHRRHRDLVRACAPRAEAALHRLAGKAASDGVSVREPYGRAFLRAVGEAASAPDPGALLRAYLGFCV